MQFWGKFSRTKVCFEIDFNLREFEWKKYIKISKKKIRNSTKRWSFLLLISNTEAEYALWQSPEEIINGDIIVWRSVKLYVSISNR